MTKKLVIDPGQRRRADKITFKDISVNKYQKTVKDEKNNFSKSDFLRIYRDMLIIREFETMLNDIKTKGQYEGIKYDYPGPAHLGIGQEASYVGQAYELGIQDYIFGSHRSHGEILAKGLSVIHKLEDNSLLEIMKNFLGGNIYKVIENNTDYQNIKDVAKEFLIYGVLAEIFGRETGFNKGLGGSMHAFFIPFGSFPNNAIVGGSADISTGAALFKLVNNKEGIVVCNIGDGAIGCGPVYESMNFAAMDQFKTLWDERHSGGLPIIYNIFNNGYGMGGQTTGETMAFGLASRLGAGVSPTQMHAETVDGYNPLAVIDAFRRKKKIIQENKGPVLLEVLTYRLSGHSPSDTDSYRNREEKDLWRKQDSLKKFKEELIELKIATEDEISKIESDCKKDIFHITKLVINEEESPRIDLENKPEFISGYMLSNEIIKNMDPGRNADVLIPKEENPRIAQIRKKERFAFDSSGNLHPKTKVYQLRDGIFEAMIDKFYEDPTLIAYGEDNRDWAGAFGVYRGLTESLPYHRFFNAPISEGAIVGTGVGYAMCGGRAVVELMYADFLGRAGDQVFNQMSKWHSMSAGILKIPLILRMSVGSKYGAQHSQDWSSLCTHIPGLKVVFPATPYDAKGLMNSALSGTDPVVFIESQRIYDIGEMFHKEGVPEGYYEIEIGDPDIKKAGEDLTILSVGATLYRVMPAAEVLEKKYGISVEVIDARSLVPFNYEKVIDSVKKTGRIIIAGDSCERSSHLKDFAQNITELCFNYLDAPPVVVGARNWITPSYELEKYFFPQPEWFVDAVHEKIMPLDGHIVKNNFSDEGKIRIYKKGV
ncbi:MAG: thiamine pyrophosphate-dependent enzyme [Actinomycetota bacterium]|nr:thiamine pyrophosphate-dependent enzyme [Actinomycetota bacterium]